MEHFRYVRSVLFAISGTKPISSQLRKDVGRWYRSIMRWLIAWKSNIICQGLKTQWAARRKLVRQSSLLDCATLKFLNIFVDSPI